MLNNIAPIALVPPSPIHCPKLVSPKIAPAIAPPVGPSTTALIATGITGAVGAALSKAHLIPAQKAADSENGKVALER